MIDLETWAFGSDSRAQGSPLSTNTGRKSSVLNVATGVDVACSRLEGRAYFELGIGAVSVLSYGPSCFDGCREVVRGNLLEEGLAGLELGVGLVRVATSLRLRHRRVGLVANIENHSSCWVTVCVDVHGKEYVIDKK